MILSSAGTLTKSEGVTYAFLLALIVVIGSVLRRRGRTAIAALALFLGVAAIEPWRQWLGDRGLPTSSSDYSLIERVPSGVHGPSVRARGLRRPPRTRRDLQPGQVARDRSATLLALLAVARKSPLLAAATGIWLLLAFLGLVIVYWAGNFRVFTLRDEVQTSAHRVAGTIVIVAAVIVPLILGLWSTEARPMNRRATRPADLTVT